MLNRLPAAVLEPRPDQAEAIELADLARRGWAPPIDGHGLFRSLMGRLPKRVRRSFDHEQLLALRQAAEEMAWGEHPIDIRLSLPLFGSHRYFVLIGGKERRADRRLKAERRARPLVRTGNIVSLVVFLCGLAGLLAGLGLAVHTLLPF